MADQFVRVRLAQIQDSDLRLFDFDYDLTFMVFFLDADENVYARYGGRDATGPDSRQSLDGLRYAMQSVLAMHDSARKQFAPRDPGEPLRVEQFTERGSFGSCIHCHQVKEAMNHKLLLDGKWNPRQAHRYPLPDNLGLRLEIDRGNVVESVTADSPASKTGLAAGDRIVTLNAVPVHSLADAMEALDRAPRQGSIPVLWQRGDANHRGRLDLPDDWRRTDISWRPSMSNHLASARMFGPDLTAEERRALDLPLDRLAFRQQQRVHQQAQDAGILPNDIVLGFNQEPLRMDAYAFQTYVRGRYVKGETVSVDIIRDGRRLRLPMTFR